MNVKFMAVFGVTVCVVSYVANSYLTSIFGTLSYLIPGVVAVAGYLVSKKLIKNTE